jgi:hypothetical protein
MKKIIPFLVLLYSSCDSPYVAPAPKQQSIKDNQNFLKAASSDITQLNTMILGIEGKAGEPIKFSNYGDSVSVYKELTELFNPDKFQCGLSDKIRKRIKESQRETKADLGFVPDDIVNAVEGNKIAIKMNDKGANYLVHSFTYQRSDGTESKLVVVDNPFTDNNFTATNWIDVKPEKFSNFYFTMDCSGYFSATAKIAARAGVAGIGRISVDAEGQTALNRNQSIVFIKAIINTPLYAAFKGKAFFDISELSDKEKKVNLLEGRIKTLESILSAIPTEDLIDARNVYIRSNFAALITSNTGSSGFNGSGELKSNVELNYVIQAEGTTKMGNTVSRKSSFKSFNTYIMDENIGVAQENITVKTIRDKITEIRGLISGLH